MRHLRHGPGRRFGGQRAAAVTAQTAGRAQDIRPFRTYHPAFARGDDLARVEGKTARISQQASAAAFVQRAKGAGRVLQHKEAMLSGKAGKGVHIRAQAKEMHGNDPPGARTQHASGGIRVKREGFRLHIGKDRTRARAGHGIGRGHPGKGRHNDLIARANPQGQQRHMQGRRAGGERHRVALAQIRGKQALKIGNAGSLTDHAALKAGGQSIQLSLIEHGSDDGHGHCSSPASSAKGIYSSLAMPLPAFSPSQSQGLTCRSREMSQRGR